MEIKIGNFKLGLLSKNFWKDIVKPSYGYFEFNTMIWRVWRICFYKVNY